MTTTDTTDPWCDESQPEGRQRQVCSVRPLERRLSDATGVGRVVGAETPSARLLGPFTGVSEDLAENDTPIAVGEEYGETSSTSSTSAIPAPTQASRVDELPTPSATSSTSSTTSSTSEACNPAALDEVDELADVQHHSSHDASSCSPTPPATTAGVRSPATARSSPRPARATGTPPMPGRWRSGSCPASRSETRRPTVTDALKAAGWTPEGEA